MVNCRGTLPIDGDSAMTPFRQMNGGFNHALVAGALRPERVLLDGDDSGVQTRAATKTRARQHEHETERGARHRPRAVAPAGNTHPDYSAGPPPRGGSSSRSANA